MSAAVNDRPHDAFASRPRLPLTGELHPLRREFERLLATGNAIALTFAVLACVIVSIWPREAPTDLGGLTRLITDRVTISPPPIAPSGQNDIGFEPSGPPVQRGVYQPEEDYNVVTDPDLGDGGLEGEGPPDGGIGPYDGWEEGESIVVPDPPAPREDHTWWDEPPVLLSCVAPVYPGMVREAGIDGTVMVRVLVAVNGKVKNAYVVDGPAALREAALASARTAIFKPALVGVHAVEVWVVIPVTFQLHGVR